VEQDELVRGSVLYNLFAIGAGAGPQENARERQRRAYRRQIEPASPMRPVFGVQYAAPGSELEGSIAEVWQRVLHVENLGIDDNFFDLGGTSLTGLQAVRELNRRLGVELSPMAIFEAPTVRILARSLQSPLSSSATARVGARQFEP
jgi:acyl carrier protein